MKRKEKKITLLVGILELLDLDVGARTEDLNEGVIVCSEALDGALDCPGIQVGEGHHHGVEEVLEVAHGSPDQLSVQVLLVVGLKGGDDLPPLVVGPGAKDVDDGVVVHGETGKGLLQFLGVLVRVEHVHAHKHEEKLPVITRGLRVDGPLEGAAELGEVHSLDVHEVDLGAGDHESDKTHIVRAKAGHAVLKAVGEEVVGALDDLHRGDEGTLDVQGHFALDGVLQVELADGDVVLDDQLEVVNAPLAENLDEGVLIGANAVLSGNVELHGVLLGQGRVGLVGRPLTLGEGQKELAIVARGVAGDISVEIAVL